MTDPDLVLDRKIVADFLTSHGQADMAPSYIDGKNDNQGGMKCVVKGIKAGRDAERERCAKLIEDNAISFNGPVAALQPRYDGDVQGLAYATAIRKGGDPS